MPLGKFTTGVNMHVSGSESGRIITVSEALKDVYQQTFVMDPEQEFLQFNLTPHILSGFHYKKRIMG